jgi:phosphoglycolate phosphatase
METTVIFDLDGVLVDSRAAIAGCTNHALAALGRPMRPEPELYPYIGPPLSHSFGELLGLELEHADVAAMMTAYRARYATVSLTDTTVEPGIPEALDQLAPDHRLAVATSKPTAFAEPLLAAVGLRRYFDVVAGPALDERAEPKTETLRTALDRLGGTRAVMVGDRSFDVVAAHAHELPAIGVTWGIGTRDELRDAERLIDAPDELAAAVADLLGE